MRIASTTIRNTMVLALDPLFFSGSVTCTVLFSSAGFITGSVSIWLANASPSHELFQTSFGHPHCSRQLHFGEVMHIDAVDHRLIRIGHRFLCLHHFNVV